MAGPVPLIDEISYKQDFSERLRMAMGKKDMRATELARLIEVNPSGNTIRDYMRGYTMPSPLILSKICVALNCDANWLLGIRKDKML